MKLVGPFVQAVTLKNLPLRGKLKDEQLEIVENAGILIENGLIKTVGNFNFIKENLDEQSLNYDLKVIETPQICLPAFVDCHTHLCFGGDRANDFSLRNSGKSYLEIAENGGGIWSTVLKTRAASHDDLLQKLLQRISFLLDLGIATIEIKSGYGLNLGEELKMLRVIKSAQALTPALLVPTCLAAHLKPKDFDGTNKDYLDYVLNKILPQVKKENLAKRVDIFIEKTAFGLEESRDFLLAAKQIGFDITVHADQFTSGSGRLAAELDAKSADHLEATILEDIKFIAQSETAATALPGASLGLGEPFAPARKLLDEGAILAIASDWNPGSAPMGNLITQASIIATYEKLSTAEVLAAITFRAAHALGLDKVGKLEENYNANFVTFNTNNFQDILYYQGSLICKNLYINGNKIK